jgi:hypothetical protein
MPFAENRADVVVVASSTRMVVTSRVAMNGEDWSGRFYGFTLTNPTFLVTHLSRITNRYHQKNCPGTVFVVLDNNSCHLFTIEYILTCLPLINGLVRTLFRQLLMVSHASNARCPPACIWFNSHIENESEQVLIRENNAEVA